MAPGCKQRLWKPRPQPEFSVQPVRLYWGAASFPNIRLVDFLLADLEVDGRQHAVLRWLALRVAERLDMLEHVPSGVIARRAFRGIGPSAAGGPRGPYSLARILCSSGRSWLMSGPWLCPVSAFLSGMNRLRPLRPVF